MPTIPNRTFSITDYGGSASNTGTANFAAVNAALAAAKNSGGGSVVIPAGTFVCNPGISVTSNINFEIDGTLKAPAYSSYGNASTHFLSFSSATNVELSGSGTLDGGATFSSGSSDTEWWGNPTLNISAVSTRPRLVQITGCSTMLISNLTMKNSASFHMAFSGSNNNVTIDGMAINTPSAAPNTDGIDVTGSNFLIKNTSVSTGDDNIVMKPGSTACANITVSTCTFGSGHGVSVGGQTNKGLNGFTVANCTFSGTSNGIHLKAGRGSGGLVQNLTFQNLTMTNVTNPFDVSSYYINGGDVSGPLTPTHVPSGGTQAEAPVLADLPNTFVSGSTPQWQNLLFKNIAISGSNTNNFFYGTPEALISNVAFDNVTYATQPSAGMNFVNDADLHFTGPTIAPIQCAVIQSLDLSSTQVTAAKLTQSFSSSLASSAATVYANRASYTNFDPSFDQTSVNTVDISGNFTLGTTAGSAGSYMLTGGTLSVGGETDIGIAGLGTITQSGGVATLGTLSLGSGGGAGTYSFSAGSFTSSALSIANHSRFTFSGGSFSSGTLTLSNGSTFTIGTGTAKTPVIHGSLSADATSRLEMNSNSLIVDYTGSADSVITSVRQALQSNSIASSTATAGQAVGYFDNAILGVGSFGGVVVDSSSLLLKTVTIGDTNNDGKVDIADLGALATNYGSTGDWQQGDFNYDGKVDIADLGLLATYYGGGSPAFLAALAELNAPALPEPTLCSTFILASLLIRRSQRHKS